MNIRMTLSAALVFGVASALGSCSSTSEPTVDASAHLRRYLTCGDPVCRGYTAGSGAPLCTTEKADDPCSIDGQQCDPKSDCNALLVCASSDPKTRTGGCPISRARYKGDIH